MSDRGSTQVRVGDEIPARTLEAVSGGDVPLPDPDLLVHLQLRRFAGCPVCNLHLQSIVRRHDEIGAVGVVEVVVFHSTVDALRPHVADLPFAVVADPGMELYVELGVESSPRSLLDPRAWPSILRGIAVSTWNVLRGRAKVPSLVPEGGRWGLPADLLIAPGGEVLAVHYGTHAADQWSVDELLAQVAATRDAGRPSRT